MKFRSRAILVLLLTAIALSVGSAYSFTRLDQVVHGDLYRNGLQLSMGWAEKYWANSRLLTICFGVSILTLSVSMAFVLVHTKTHGKGSKSASCALLVVGIATAGFSTIFINRLDYIVHHDLYGYGLKFSLEWAVPYWTYARLVLGLQGLAIMMTGISVAMILAGKSQMEAKILPKTRAPLKTGKTKLTCTLLFSVGGVALASSIYYSSSILAFIGLGFVFWGTLLLYVTPTKRVKLELLNAIGLSTLTNIEKILADFNCSAKGIYLPPKYMTDVESSLVFIPSKAEQPLPKPNEVNEEKSYSRNPNGLFLVPPGLTLSKLFEKELGKSFTKTGVPYLREKLPKLVIEDLELMENIDVATQGNTITIEMKNHIFREICEETRKYQRVHDSVGCLLCSAFACVLAKATGKPIVIEKEEQTQDGENAEIRYSILKE